ncbi:inorganic phosphate transporter [Thermococcus sp. M39]|uniref:inorganic phosphate transporter n=1 Tax=unclassified Thermococcus TaxID=2627626 RepID=UPI00143B4FC6|nr:MULTISPECIES: inorganic phosphate transporter [unclassified Thermococcus]NJE07801.1 inorganic phosphate transporter [Thermococcus sp. M39]NJE12355.1 inorganic phosphate transporter [Thermococcus sp. LS2]
MDWAIIAAGLFMAWSIGANDSAKAVGIAVGSEILSFKRAIFLIGVFSLLGAFFGSSNVAHTVGSNIVPNFDKSYIPFALLASALAVTFASLRGLPISTTQSIIGAIVGIGVYQKTYVNWSIVLKIALAWVVSPIAAAILSILVFAIYGRIINHISKIYEIEVLYRWMIILSSAYASFNLGANELSNVIGLLTYSTNIEGNTLKLILALALFFGALTFSYEVLMTIGKNLTQLGPLAGFSAQFGSALAVTSANIIGLPVSSGQAIIGGIIGLGLLKGQKINKKLTFNIVKGWVLAPLVSCLLTLLFIKIFSVLPLTF